MVYLCEEQNAPSLPVKSFGTLEKQVEPILAVYTEVLIIPDCNKHHGARAYR